MSPGHEHAMARFFFHLRTPSGELIRDDQGVELTDLDAAVREADLAARGFAGDAKLGGCDYSGWNFEIRSDSGSINVPAFVSEPELADER
jgi:hypothetical protein